MHEQDELANAILVPPLFERIYNEPNCPYDVLGHVWSDYKHALDEIVLWGHIDMHRARYFLENAAYLYDDYGKSILQLTKREMRFVLEDVKLRVILYQNIWVPLAPFE